MNGGEIGSLGLLVAAMIGLFVFDPFGLVERLSLERGGFERPKPKNSGGEEPTPKGQEQTERHETSLPLDIAPDLPSAPPTTQPAISFVNEQTHPLQRFHTSAVSDGRNWIRCEQIKVSGTQGNLENLEICIKAEMKSKDENNSQAIQPNIIALLEYGQKPQLFLQDSSNNKTTCAFSAPFQLFDVWIACADLPLAPETANGATKPKLLHVSLAVELIDKREQALTKGDTNQPSADREFEILGPLSLRPARLELYSLAGTPLSSISSEKLVLASAIEDAPKLPIQKFSALFHEGENTARFDIQLVGGWPNPDTPPPEALRLQIEQKTAFDNMVQLHHAEDHASQLVVEAALSDRPRARLELPVDITINSPNIDEFLWSAQVTKDITATLWAAWDSKWKPVARLPLELKLRRAANRSSLAIDFGTAAIAMGGAPSTFSPKKDEIKLFQLGERAENAHCYHDESDPALLSSSLSLSQSIDTEHKQRLLLGDKNRQQTYIADQNWLKRRIELGLSYHIALPAPGMKHKHQEELIVDSIKHKFNALPNGWRVLRHDDIATRQGTQTITCKGALIDDVFRDTLIELIDLYISPGAERQQYRRGRLVLTTPNNYQLWQQDRYRSIVKPAAALLDIDDDDILFVTEADAAALAAITEEEKPDRPYDWLLIYDLGAGTLDISVVRVTYAQGSATPRNWLVANRVSVPLAGNSIDEAIARIAHAYLDHHSTNRAATEREDFLYQHPVFNKNGDLNSKDADKDWRWAFRSFRHAIREAKKELSIWAVKNEDRKYSWPDERPLRVEVGEIESNETIVNRHRGTDFRRGTENRFDLELHDEGDQQARAIIDDHLFCKNGKTIELDMPRSWFDGSEDPPAEIAEPCKEMNELLDFLAVISPDIALKGAREMMQGGRISRVIISGRGALFPEIHQRFSSFCMNNSLGTGEPKRAPNLKNGVVRGAIKWTMFAGLYERGDFHPKTSFALVPAYHQQHDISWGEDSLILLGSPLNRKIRWSELEEMNLVVLPKGLDLETINKCKNKRLMQFFTANRWACGSRHSWSNCQRY